MARMRSSSASREASADTLYRRPPREEGLSGTSAMAPNLSTGKNNRRERLLRRHRGTERDAGYAFHLRVLRLLQLFAVRVRVKLGVFVRRLVRVQNGQQHLGE